MDQAQQMMDSRERIIRQRLSAEYKKAEKELQKELNEYFKRFQKQDKEKAKLVLQGRLDQSEYIKWRKNKMLYKETLSQKVDVMSQHLLNVNKQARDIIRKEMFGVYADQYNFGKYEVEKGLKVNTSFTLFDQKTVERMAEKNPKLLPERTAPDGKVLRYSRRKVNTAITQGVLKGDSIDKIARRLTDVVGIEEGYARLNARTAMTGAQNAGRLDSYFDSKSLGINIKKQWMATLDERTRTSHQAMDGEVVDIEDKFSNELEYPADPEGDPAEVYNCRCTMIAVLPDFPPQNMMRLDNVNGTPIEYATYNEWAGWKKQAAKKTVNDNRMFAKKTNNFEDETRTTLKQSYENHRINNNLSSVPAGDLPDNFFEASYGKIDPRIANAISKELSTLTGAYDTTLCKVRIMNKSEFWARRNTFATVMHDYETDISTLLINPVKCADHDKLLKRLKELVENKYIPSIDEVNYARYITTHEFAHTLFDMKSELNNSRNWVGSDYQKIKRVRKDIDKIYKDYLAEIGELDRKRKALEADYIMGNAKAGDEARKIIKKINKVRISRYSMENSDEFMAEAFAQSRLGKSDNKYVKKVMDIINKNFKRG